VTQLPEPSAKRLQRPSWRDARLLVGVVLVLLGTAVGARIIAGADDTVPMYAASTVIRPGDRLTVDNLRRVDVQLGDEASRYLSARAVVPDDSYALRDIPEGELVPASAVGSRSTVTVQPVTVEVDASSARGLPAGAVVDHRSPLYGRPLASVFCAAVSAGSVPWCSTVGSYARPVSLVLYIQSHWPSFAPHTVGA